MAVDLTAAQLAAGIRLGDSTEEIEQATRLLATCKALIEEAAPDAPTSVQNEACIRLAGFLFDSPHTDASAAMTRSGAGSLLLHFRTHRAGIVGDAPAAAGTSTTPSSDPSPTPPGEGVIEQRVAELIEEHAGEANAHHTPPTLPMPANPAEAAAGSSTTIRAWTSALIRTAINAVVPAWARSGDATPIPAPKLANAPRDSHLDIVNTLNGRLPAPPVAMRLGWNQSRVMHAGIFTRANDHPIDGAAIGTTAGLAVPPFPPALDTDPTLYLGVWLAGDPDVAAIQRAANDETANFPAGDKRALTVDGTGGHYYPSRVRFTPKTGDLLRVVVPGARILTEDDALAAGAAPRWYEMARLLTNDLASGTAADMTLRSDGTAKFADAAAVRAAIASKAISMLVLQRSDSDAQVPGVNAPNFLGSAAANYAVEFRFPNGEHAVVRFTPTAITVTPGFAITSTLRLDLGVFS